jgi:peroxiredoxin
VFYLHAFWVWALLLVRADLILKPQVASATGKPAPDFSLKDHNGAIFILSGQKGTWVLLYFYRGYWWPYCMTELRGLAQHAEDLEQEK